MPWTFARPAAVLPLRAIGAGRLSFAGLVVGSLCPDLGYHVGLIGLAAIAHAPLGLLTVCLPSGLLLVVVVRLLRRPVVHLLPQPHRDALRSLPELALDTPTAWFVVALSIVIGAATHLAWDAFTHGYGAFVRAAPFLQQRVFDFGGRRFAVYNVLQHASTVFGIAVLLVAYRRWLNTIEVTPSGGDHRDDTWRRRLLASLAIGSVVVALPLAWIAAHAADGLDAPGDPTRMLVRFVIAASCLFATALVCAALIAPSIGRHPPVGS